LKPRNPKSLCQWILVAISVAIFIAISTHSHAQTCLNGLPESLRSAIEQDHWTIVQPEDLSEADLRFWKNGHPGECPGVAAGDFSSKAKSSFIVALIQRDDQKNLLEQVLLVTLKKNRPVTEVAVPPTQVPTPRVVWKLAKGRYLGIDGTKASISRNSFVFEKLVGSAKQYYYDGSHLKSFILSY
jgi:hypothetical protein